MNEEQDTTEQRITAYFAAKQERLRAPGQLFQQLEAKMAISETPTKQPFARRWPVFLVPAVGAVALAVALLYITGSFGGWGGPAGRSAQDVLAGSFDALFDPQRIGLNSYVGIADFTGTDANGNPRTSQLKIWYSAPGRYRFEVGIEGISQPGLVFVADGERYWGYAPATNTYAEGTKEDLFITLFFFMPLATGPNGMGATNIEDLLKNYSTSHQHLSLAGEDTVLGRPVYIVEITPAWTESSSSSVNETPVQTSGGVMRFWIDKKTFFALKLHADTLKDEPPFEMAFTSYSANTPVDDGLFHFEPPNGATKVDHDSFFYSSSETRHDGVVTVEPVTPAAIETPSP